MPSLEWIKLTCDLPDKWQTQRLRRLTKLRTTDEVVGKLFRVWRHFENQSRGGFIPHIDAVDLDTLVGKKGFAEAMSQVGWLYIEADGLRIPNFSEYMGGASRDRDAAAERMRRSRNNAGILPEREQNNTETQPEHSQNKTVTETEQEPNKSATETEQARNENVTVTPPKKEKEKEKEESLCGDTPPGEKTTSDTTKTPPAKKAAKSSDKPREPNPLFDAIAEVTGLDPATAGGLIGSVAASLSKAEKPYGPADIREFARRFHEFCPHAAKDTPPRLRPTAKEIERYIGLIRAGPPAATPTTRAPTIAYD
jgi:hypothetical protein